MSQFIVTIKLPNNPNHNPKKKQTRECECSDFCTDATGAHHSFLVESESRESVEQFFAYNNVVAGMRVGHITRIEEVSGLIKL
jgi:hypothetical protein